MKKALPIALLVSGLVLGLGSCSKSDSPTAPRPSPTPQTVSVTLTVSATTAVVGEVVEARATVRSGSAPVADGTPVRFVVAGGALTTGVAEATVTTQGGVASVGFTAKQEGTAQVSAAVGSASDTKSVRFLAVAPPSGPPQFTSITPSSGSPRGGYTAVIKGNNLCKGYLAGQCAIPADVAFRLKYQVKVGEERSQQTGQITIRYEERNRDVTPVVQNYRGSGTADELTVQVPEVDPGIVLQPFYAGIFLSNKVTVGNQQFGDNLEVRDAFFFNPDYQAVGFPKIFGVSPLQGSWQGGETVRITGENLCVFLDFTSGRCVTSVAPSVLFVLSNETVNAWAEVVAVSPDGRELTVRTPRASITAPTQDVYADIIVGNVSGSDTQSRAFVYPSSGQPAVTPHLHALSPNAGPIEGGTRVTIFGTGFQAPVQVLFGDRQAQVVSSNFNQIVCIAPSIAPSQPGSPTTVQVSVVNVLTGKVSDNSLPYRYGEAMFISAITPNTGYILGWNPATIYGQGFVAPVQVEVTAGGITKQAEVLSVSGTSIQVKMPPFAELVGAQGCTPVPATFRVTNIGSNLSATGPTYTYLCSGGISGP